MTISTDRTDYWQAKAEFTESARLFKELDDDHGKAIATVYLGMIERFLGNDDLSISHYETAAEVMHDVSDHGGAAFAFRGIGQICLKRHEYVEAEAWLDRALAMYELAGSPQGRAQVMCWQGMLYLQQNRYLEADGRLREALEIAQQLGDRPGEAQCLRGLGGCHKQLGQHEQARTLLTQALDLVRQPLPTHLEARIRDALADL